MLPCPHPCPLSIFRTSLAPDAGSGLALAAGVTTHISECVSVTASRSLGLLLVLQMRKSKFSPFQNTHPCLFLDGVRLSVLRSVFHPLSRTRKMVDETSGTVRVKVAFPVRWQKAVEKGFTLAQLAACPLPVHRADRTDCRFSSMCPRLSHNSQEWDNS